MAKSKKKMLKLIPKGHRLNLSDFALFLSVMKNKRAYECTLSIILEEPELELEEVKVEQVVLNKDGKRAIRLDAWAKDRKSRLFDMEMQNDVRGDDIPKRSRFYQGLMDTPILKSGKSTKYRQLPSSIIIFITPLYNFSIKNVIQDFLMYNKFANKKIRKKVILYDKLIIQRKNYNW